MKSRSFKWSWCVAVFALLAVLGGCGGSSDSAGTGKEATSELTVAQFKTRADAACAQAQQKKESALNAAYSRLNEEGQGGKAAGEEVIRIAVRPIAALNQELSDLAAASNEVPQEVGPMIEAFEREVQALEKDPASGLEGGGEFKQANALALQLGLENCARI